MTTLSKSIDNYDRAVKERPIIFSTDMVKAILDGRKTQTRRIVKQQPFHIVGDMLSPYRWYAADQGAFCGDVEREIKCPYGFPDDILWVREKFMKLDQNNFTSGRKHLYAADIHESKVAQYAKRLWRPSIHMPYEAARIFLRITDIRVERLQDISEDDACAEGITGDKHDELWKDYAMGNDPEACRFIEPSRSFKSLWNSINLKRASWESNPWVWVITFEKIES